MTKEEAEKVGKIVARADGGCSVCVSALIKRLNEAFPDFVWTYNENAPEPPEPPDDDSPDWSAYEAWVEARVDCRVSVSSAVGDT